MKNILNKAPGQEGYAIGVKVKDSFLLLSSRRPACQTAGRFTLIIADILLSYTGLLN